jgi:hypothetical protein
MNYKKHLITVLIISLIKAVSFGQVLQKSLLFNQIEKGIKQSNEYNYINNGNFDVDSICSITSNRLVKLLKTKRLSIKEEKKLGLEYIQKTEDSSNIRIYHFGYSSGGSRGFVTYPIIQWTNRKGKIFAYNLSNYLHCRFIGIKKLKSNDKNLYILLGGEKAFNSCVSKIAYVIRIKGDYLILDYPAFKNRAYLNLCNAAFSFDEKSQTLTLSDIGSDEKLEFIPGDKLVTSNQANLELINWFGEPYYYETIYMKFNNNKFRKPRKK